MWRILGNISTFPHFLPFSCPSLPSLASPAPRWHGRHLPAPNPVIGAPGNPLIGPTDPSYYTQLWTPPPAAHQYPIFYTHGTPDTDAEIKKKDRDVNKEMTARQTDRKINIQINRHRDNDRNLIKRKTNTQTNRYTD